MYGPSYDVNVHLIYLYTNLFRRINESLAGRTATPVLDTYSLWI